MTDKLMFSSVLFCFNNYKKTSLIMCICGQSETRRTNVNCIIDTNCGEQVKGGTTNI